MRILPYFIFLTGAIALSGAEPAITSVITSPSTMHRIASNIEFAGTPIREITEREIGRKFTIDGKDYMDMEPWGPHGLVMREKATEKYWLFGPFDLAVEHGWCWYPERATELKNRLFGLCHARNSLWMGTHAGVSEYHISDGSWSRYDLSEMHPNRIRVEYADEDYLFVTYGSYASGGTTEPLPSLDIYSFGNDHWVHVEEISTNGAHLGHTGMTQIGNIKYELYASRAYIPISEDPHLYLCWPKKITFDAAHGEYGLEYGSAANGAVSTVLRFKKSDLATGAHPWIPWYLN